MQKKFHESFLQVIISFIIFFFLPLFIDTNPFFILQAVALHLYRDDPEVLNCYNVLFYNHCIELTPFFFLLQVDMDKIKRNNDWR